MNSALDTEFDSAAPHYDLMVSLNPGYHRHLRSAAQSMVDRLPRDRPLHLVDLGCGSGASTAAVLDRLGPAGSADVDLVGVDASDGMLDVARDKDWPRGVRFVHGYAEDVAVRADEWGLEPADAVFAAYLFRNVEDRDATLGAVRDVLAPGGWLVAQEYSVTGSRLAIALWTLVCWTIVIPLSLVLTRRAALYRYLWRSVVRFDSVARFEARLRDAGFDQVATSTVEGLRSGPAGWQRGILHTVIAQRPPEW